MPEQLNLATSESALLWEDYLRRIYPDSRKPSVRKSDTGGQMIYLLSGMSVSVFPLDNLAKHLNQNTGLQVVLESLPGHGANQSDLLDYRYDAWENDCKQRFFSTWRAAACPQVILGGFSAGAVMAYQLAHTLEAQHPGKLSAFLSLACAANFSRPLQRWQLWLANLLSNLPCTHQMIRGKWYPSKRSADADLVSEDYWKQPQHLGYPLEGLIQLYRLQRRMLRSLSSRKEVLKVPLGFFHGEQDTRVDVKIIQALCRKIAKVRSKPHLVTIPGAPHTLTLGLPHVQELVSQKIEEFVLEVWG